MGTNDKKVLLQSKENHIKKSNEISMAELNYGLNLNQMQLLAFAIYSTQQDGRTKFQKHEFQKKFGIEQYRTEDAYEDSRKIMDLKVSTKNIENERFKFWNVYIAMDYDKGTFTFEWSPKMIPHILDIKERYVVTDLQVASHFKSGFSWRLYEYLKAHYGYFRLILSKQEIYELFNVQDKKTYQKFIGRFKESVLNVAIKEINEYTELDVWYKEQKEGRSIVGFEIYWHKGKVVQKATQKQVNYIKGAIDFVTDNTLAYVQIKNDNNRVRAFELIEEIKEYKNLITEPINIDTDKAHHIIKDIEFYLEQLSNFIGHDKPKRDTSFYYNWLEE